MEISPISGIRALPMIKATPANSELTPLFDIENSPRAGDETFTSSNQNSSGGQDDEDLEDPPGEEMQESASASDPSDFPRPRQVNFFA
jgi:hypothetical protein